MQELAKTILMVKSLIEFGGLSKPDFKEIVKTLGEEENEKSH